MRLLIAVLLSVALIGLHQDQNTHFNNSEAKVAVAKPAGQVRQVATAPAQEAKQVATPAPQPVPQPQTPPTTPEQIMSAAGISPSDYGYVTFIVSHESSWRWNATEPRTGAYGLCQALPAIKLASSGADWQTNPVTQMKWCNTYAVTRYGSWASAYSTWVAQRWW